MGFKIKALLIAAVLCLAFTGLSSAADDSKVCWEKPCNTTVEQCDNETVFTLNDVDSEAEVVKSEHGYYYVSMRNVTEDGERIVTTGDIRLTGYHSKYDPNTKVVTGDEDAKDEVAEIVDEPFKYMDINDNGQYDLYDPVYVDVDNDGEISSGDIRLTDVPPVDVHSLEKTEEEYGEKLADAGEWGLEAWSVVESGDEDKGMDIGAIGSGQAADLLGWVDADDSGDWTCEDKLYIRAPNDHEWFADVVTINDVRLYIPPEEECVPECGTKVVQGDHDATYALTLPEDAKLVQLEDEPTAVYISMDGSDDVSVGDVRLTGVSTEYDPNTKVTYSNKVDLGKDYEDMDQDAIKYADIDGQPGYTVGDPLYIDMDGDDAVSAGDVRLNKVPIFETDGMEPGEVGETYSVVESGSFDADADSEFELEDLGDISDRLGYIDSDATGDWTCPDKLYFQQLVGDEYVDENESDMSHPKDKFVTIGDHRIYEPFSDEMSPFEGLEDWPECGTKVVKCDVDVTYALMDNKGDDIEDLIRYTDRNSNEVFDEGDNAYIDMDDNNRVTVGDVRLTDVSVDGQYFYYNNTKVEQHDKDIGEDLTKESDGEYRWFADSNRDLLSMIGEELVDIENGELFFNIMILDADCSKTWTCVDGLFLQVDHAAFENASDVHMDEYDVGAPADGYNEANLDFVTHKDGRLFIPPEMVDGTNGGEDEPEEFWMNYDANDNGEIEKSEALEAIDDYFADGSEMTKDDVMNVINKFFG